MLNLVWPLSRLGGVLWGRLRPPSLPSPPPCSGRGTRDLEGLSTRVPLGLAAAPGDGENSPSAWPHSLLSPDLCLFKLLFISIACLHAPQCLCCRSVTSFFSTVNLHLSRCLNDQTAAFNIQERQMKWLITTRLLAITTDKRTHGLHWDFIASTNCIPCPGHCYTTMILLCVSSFFSLSA